MLSFAKRRLKAALTRLRGVPARAKANKKALANGGLLLFTFLFGGAMCIMLVMPMQFPVRQGNLSYSLSTGSTSGGYVQFSLGPVGSVNFRTHAIPINLKMNLVFNRDITTGQDLPDTVRNSVKKFKYDASNAFYIFLLSRILIVALIGLSAGIATSYGSQNWSKKRFAKWGVICFVSPALVLIGISYISLDRTPDISYTGEIAQDISKALPYVEHVTGGYNLKKNLLQTFVEGAVILNDEMNSLASSSSDQTGTQILVASDIHDNVVGMQIINQLVASDGVSAVILAGDITTGGSSWESHLFDDSLSVGTVPVFYIGGNHESSSAMKAFTQIGYELLGNQEKNIGGVRIIGQSDPTAYNDSMVATPQQLLDSSEALAGTWYNNENPANLVVVHDLSQADGIVGLAQTDKRNVTVVYGHDHTVGHKTVGTVSLVDCGTGGASGLDGISRGTVYTYQILNFSSEPNPRLTGILTLEFYDLKHLKSMNYTSVN